MPCNKTNNGLFISRFFYPICSFGFHAATDLTDRPAAVLAGGTRAWEAAGLPIERGMLRAVEEVDDVYKRPYEGTDNAAAAMQAYLDWEFGLVEQLARDGTHGFQVL